MSLTVVVLLCGLTAAILAFGLSASRRLPVDPVDPALAQQAIRRSILRHPRVRRFLRERLDRHTAGGFLLTASFVVVFVVAIVVGQLLTMIHERSWLANADRSVASWGSKNGTSTTVHILTWITQLGSTIGITIALSLTAAIDYYRRRNAEVFAFVATVGLGQVVLSNVLKRVVARPRPVVLHLVAASGYSFPSGHTVAAAACMSAIALVFGAGRSRRVRAVLAGAAASIAISVATSRALLGVHWLSDVLAGLFIGWGWFTVVAIAFGGRAQRLGDPVSDHPQGAAQVVITPAPSTPSASAGG
ncbi:MAG: phosphatase PAP2 family protein [Actinomycetota bacterium]